MNDELHAFIVDGEDGLCAVLLDGSWTPLVAVRPSLVPHMEKLAQHVANVSGKTIRHYKFTQREEVEVITP